MNTDTKTVRGKGEKRRKKNPGGRAVEEQKSTSVFNNAQSCK